MLEFTCFRTTSTIKEMKIRIQEKFGLNISKSTVHRNMQRMKFSYITSRPRSIMVCSRLLARLCLSWIFTNCILNAYLAHP
nr:MULTISPECIES: winged helix-turn-helix domain-containing protein [unclassified Wolbachia]